MNPVDEAMAAFRSCAPATSLNTASPMEIRKVEGVSWPTVTRLTMARPLESWEQVERLAGSSACERLRAWFVRLSPLPVEPGPEGVEYRPTAEDGRCWVAEGEAFEDYEQANERVQIEAWKAHADELRPATWGECQERMPEGLCPFVACRHHLWSDTEGDVLQFEIAVDELHPDDIGETCSLRVADLVRLEPRTGGDWIGRADKNPIPGPMRKRGSWRRQQDQPGNSMNAARVGRLLRRCRETIRTAEEAAVAKVADDVEMVDWLRSSGMSSVPRKQREREMKNESDRSQKWHEELGKVVAESLLMRVGEVLLAVGAQEAIAEAMYTFDIEWCPSCCAWTESQEGVADDDWLDGGRCKSCGGVQGHGDDPRSMVAAIVRLDDATRPAQPGDTVASTTSVDVGGRTYSQLVVRQAIKGGSQLVLETPDTGEVHVGNKRSWIVARRASHA